MIAQYAQAALVAELKRPTMPAMREDHVSLGWSAARKLRAAVDGLTRVVTVELFAAARAAGVGGAGEDRFLAPDLAAARAVSGGSSASRSRWSRAGRADHGRQGKRAWSPTLVGAPPRGDGQQGPVREATAEGRRSAAASPPCCPR